MLLHVAELHECGGLREQPEAMWGMREATGAGFPGVYRHAGEEAKPRDPKGWVAEGEREFLS